MLPIEGPEVTLERIAYTWSFSKFKSFKSCNERYAFEYLLRMRPEPPTQKPFFQGSVAHELIESGFEAFQQGLVTSKQFPEWVLDNLDATFNKHLGRVLDWSGQAEIDAAKEESRALATAYAALVLENELISLQSQCEYTIGTFNNPLVFENGLRLTGFIDWLKLTGDTGVVLDAKTSRGFQYIDKDQLVFYAICAEKVFNVEVNRVAWMMIRHNKTYWYDITRDDKDRLIAGLLGASRIVLDMDMRSFPSFSLCKDCLFADKCAHHRNWIISPDLDMKADF